MFTQARRRMVSTQIKARGINDSRVLEAFSEIPRHMFVSEDLQMDAYEDYPLPIGHGQTISQPYIVALMTSQLELRGDEKILEVGTGSGYQAAILSRLAAEIHTVEIINELALAAGQKLQELGYSNIHVHKGDGSSGWPASAPYDGILVTAASPEVPQNLIDQIETGGRIVIPVGERWRQVLEVWVKRQDRVEKKEILPVVFVPLKGEHGWQDSDW